MSDNTNKNNKNNIMDNEDHHDSSSDYDDNDDHDINKDDGDETTPTPMLLSQRQQLQQQHDPSNFPYVYNRWSRYEDDKLKQAIQLFGEDNSK